MGGQGGRFGGQAAGGGPGHVRRLSVGGDGRGCVDRSDQGHGERRLPEGRGAGEEQVGRHPGQDVVGTVEGDDLHRVDARDLDTEQAQAGCFHQRVDRQVDQIGAGTVSRKLRQRHLVEGMGEGGVDLAVERVGEIGAADEAPVDRHPQGGVRRVAGGDLQTEAQIRAGAAAADPRGSATSLRRSRWPPVRALAVERRGRAGKAQGGDADDQHEDHQGRDRAQPAPAGARLVAPPGHRNPAESTESPAGSRRKPTRW